MAFGIDDAIGIAGALLGASGSGGGSAQTTVDKSPWGPVQPWLTNNIGYGQQLQGYYQANPFSAAQQSAYGNLLGANNVYRSMMPSLLAQMSNHTGYDMRNPQARSTPFNFTGGNLGFAPVVGNYQAPDVSQYKVAAAPAAAPVVDNFYGPMGANGGGANGAK